MKLNMGPKTPPPSHPYREPEVGDIYRKVGGPAGYWWVVSRHGGAVHVFSLDTSGNITGAQRYAEYYFRRNDHRRCGFAAIPDELHVTWLDQ